MIGFRDRTLGPFWVPKRHKLGVLGPLGTCLLDASRVNKVLEQFHDATEILALSASAA